ncbi:MAG: hypothetical protein RR325_03015, partial [Bacilli bacterium]
KWIPNKEFQKWCGELEPSVYESENELEICDSYALIFEKKLKEIEKEKEKYNYSQDPSSIALRKIVEENNQKRFNEQISEEKHR